jgi:hypothetical protein
LDNNKERPPRAVGKVIFFQKKKFGTVLLSYVCPSDFKKTIRIFSRPDSSLHAGKARELKPVRVELHDDVVKCLAINGRNRLRLLRHGKLEKSWAVIPITSSNGLHITSSLIARLGRRNGKADGFERNRTRCLVASQRSVTRAFFDGTMPMVRLQTISTMFLSFLPRCL